MSNFYYSKIDLIKIKLNKLRAEISSINYEINVIVDFMKEEEKKIKKKKKNEECLIM